MKLTGAHRVLNSRFNLTKIRVLFQEQRLRTFVMNVRNSKPAFIDAVEQLTQRQVKNINSEEFFTLLTGETAPTCNVCGNKVGFNRSENKFKTYCSKSCVNKAPELVAKRKATIRERYGVDNPWQATEVKEKISKTNIERYGRANPSGHPDVIKKRRKTAMKNYGTTHHTKCSDWQRAMEKQMLERYGVTNAAKLQSSIDKARRTCLERYGETNPMFTKGMKDYVKAMSIAGSMKKYGVPNAMMDDDVLKNWSSGLSSKEDIEFLGRKMRVQGYEHQALTWLWNKRAFFDAENTPIVIPYKDKYGKRRKYLPDFVITMMDGSKRIVEVKSWFTLTRIKKESVKAAVTYAKRHKMDYYIVIADPEIQDCKIVVNPSCVKLEALIHGASLLTGRRSW